MLFITLLAVSILSCIFVESWSSQATNGEVPPPMDGHTFTKINNHSAVVFGGYSESRNSNDAYLLDMQNWVCSHNKCTHIIANVIRAQNIKHYNYYYSKQGRSQGVCSYQETPLSPS